MRHLIVLITLIIFSAIIDLSSTTPTHVRSTDNNARKKLVCYFGSWAKYRWGRGTFDVENIDPFICTHLIFAFAGLRAGEHTIYALDEYNELEENWGRGAYKRFTNLTLQNPDVIPLLAIGGWNEGSEKYSDMASTFESRRTFIDSVIPFIQRQNFKGLDLDWEYPASRGGRPEDKRNFALLCREMREEFDKHGLLLTAAVSAGEFTIRDAYDIPSISRDLHFINVMTYDFRGAWEAFTGHHTPLRQLPSETGNDTLLNLNHAINYWIEAGAPPEKLILGMATYGRGFVLNNPDENGLYAPANQGIPAGPYTRESGFWGYNEICERFDSDGHSSWTIVRPAYYEAPYAYRGNLWIGYEDVISIARKTEWALEKGLGGGMFWSVETDDFHGSCSTSAEPNPLIKTAWRIFNGEIPTPPPITTTTQDPTAPTTSTTTTTTTVRPTGPPSPHCQVEGINGERCSEVFYSCSWNGDSWNEHEFRCTAPLLFDPAILTCNWRDMIDCDL